MILVGGLVISTGYGLYLDIGPTANCNAIVFSTGASRLPAAGGE
jgi:hypothetical protein